MMTLSKGDASLWLSVSEYTLLIFALIVVIGLIGELKLPSWHHRLELFEMLVLIGCGGELLADGGIFLLSRKLEALANLEIAGLKKSADDARLQAASANKQASDANALAKQYESGIAEAYARAKSAEASVAVADAASKKAVATVITAEARIKDAESRVADASAKVAMADARIAEANRDAAEATAVALQARLELARMKTPRALTSSQREQIAESLRPYSGMPFMVAINPVPEAIDLAQAIVSSLLASGWKWTFIERFGVPNISIGTGTAVLWYKDGVTISFKRPVVSTLKDIQAANAGRSLALTLEKHGLGRVAFEQIPADMAVEYIPAGIVVVVVGSKKVQ